MSGPPPAVVVSSPGTLRIPMIALNAYQNAERMMAASYPGCGISWNLLAGIGRIESMHANGGATDASGSAVRPIYGPALDGTLPGNEVIVQSRNAGRVTYARAMGPMQFLPGTWSRYASDGDGDGKADVQNLYDSSAGRGPLPVQRRAEPARSVAGDDGDPALQQLDGLRPATCWAGRRRTRPASCRWTCRRSPGRSRRSPTCTWTTTRASGPGLPMNVARPARRRSARDGAVGQHGAHRCRKPDDVLTVFPDRRPKPGCRECPG